MRLQDKVVTITGSGSGLGREGAMLFASEGAKIVTSDVVPGRAQKVAKEIEAAGGSALGIDADVRVEADMERLVDETTRAFGRIDVMWANAGVYDRFVGRDLTRRWSGCRDAARSGPIGRWLPGSAGR